MTIAFDSGETDRLRRQLQDAAGRIGGAVPAMPPDSAYGSGVLAAAASSFQTSVTRSVDSLTQKVTAMDDGVRDTAELFDSFETDVKAKIASMLEIL